MVPDVAMQLGVSPRTLRRQLSAEGVTFKAILDDIRHQRSTELLRRTSHT